MFKNTSRQRTIFEPEYLVASSTKRRLKDTWAEGFATNVLPILLRAEQRFSILYSKKTGRPNWSVARMLGISILQELQDLDDQSALDSFSFDSRWQHALGVGSKEAYLSRRSLVDFRSRIVAIDPQMKSIRAVFDEVADGAIDDLEISVKEQRLDSTRIVSNIFTCGRTDLFRKTLVHFISWLSQNQPSKLKRLSRRLKEWYERSKEKGWFSVVGNLEDKKRKQLLSDLARWLYQVIQVFTKDKAVNQHEPYQLVKRLFEEHCELVSRDLEGMKKSRDEKGSTPHSGKLKVNEGKWEIQEIKVKAKPENPGQNLQSPYDPDAGFSGHKGPGYFTHVCETCNNEGIEIITDYEVVSAGQTDRGHDSQVIDRLEQHNKMPKRLYDDGGYTTAIGFHEAKHRGVEIYSPFTDRRDLKKTFTRDRFEYNDFGFCIKCPMGHAPIKCVDIYMNRSTSKNPGPPKKAYFDGNICCKCRLKHKCITTRPTEHFGNFILDIQPQMVSRDSAINEQQKKEWWQAYAIRSGIEATMSELKRRHGMGRLRVRRMARVRLAVALKIIACNAKRWIRAKSARKRPSGGSNKTSRSKSQNTIYPPATLLRVA